MLNVFTAVKLFFLPWLLQSLLLSVWGLLSLCTGVTQELASTAKSKEKEEKATRKEMTKYSVAHQAFHLSISANGTKEYLKEYTTKQKGLKLDTKDKIDSNTWTFTDILFI
jgi:hypothetical protein